MAHETRMHEVAIVGGGPIGLELAVALRQAGVEPLHLEAGPVGSTLLWWAPETQFFSSPERIEIAGVPLVTPDQSKATREQYLAYLRGVAMQFNLHVHTYTRVRRIECRADGGFELLTRRSAHGVGGPEEQHEPVAVADDAADSTQRWRVRNLVLAIGNMHRPRRLDVPGEDLPHVSHYLADPHVYFGSRVLIVGGKNSAVEAAIRLYRCGARVAISYRREAFDEKRVKYWLRPELEWLISKGKIAFHPRTLVQSIRPGRAALVDAEDCSPRGDVPADFVLLLTGYEQDPDLFEQLDVELVGEDRAPRFDPDTMQTNIPGVYVAGTAAGGTQKRTRVFIETSHVHVGRIVRALTGVDVPWVDQAQYSALEES